MKNKKIWLVAACAVLALTMSVIGTIAYLTGSTGPVVNTFTVGKLLDDPLNFVVKEHEATDTDKDGVYTLDDGKEVTTNTYDHVLPGVDLPKDPFVKTEETMKLDAYVFVEVVKSEDFGTNLHFTVDSNNWTEISGATGKNGGQVYAMKANGGIAKAGEMLGPIKVLTDDKITVDNAPITDAEAQFGGDVTFYGYMIQAAGFEDATDAWTKGFATSV